MKRIPSARYEKRLPPNWYSGTDLKSRPRHVPPLRPLSLTGLMRNRNASIAAMKRRRQEWGLPHA